MITKIIRQIFKNFLRAHICFEWFDVDVWNKLYEISQ